MFLATTELEQFWDKNKKILFLDEWCIYNKSINVDLNYTVLPYHWDSQDKMLNDTAYVYNVFNQISPVLAKQLNCIHNVNYSNRSWKFLFGPWLYHFISIYFDRYSMIVDAINRFKNLTSIIAQESYPPITFNEFYERSIFNDVEYDFIIISEIIKTLKSNIDYNSVSYEISEWNSSIHKYKNFERGKNISTYSKYFGNLIPNIKTAIISIISNYYNDVTVLSSQLPPHKIKAALKKSGQLPLIHTNTKFRNNYHIDESLRNTSVGIDSEDAFINLLNKNIFKNIPREYLEGFKSNYNKIKRYVPKKLKLVLYRSGHDGSTYKRYYGFEAINNGAKILSFQHGGGYGVNDFISQEDAIAINLSDRFFSWGWQSDNPKVKRFYNVKTIWMKKDYKYNKNGNIILFGTACRIRFSGFVQGRLQDNKIKHIKYNINLIKTLDKHVYRKLVYRFHWQMGYNEKDKIKNRFPDLNISCREEQSHFNNEMGYCSLAISTGNYTTLLQTFTLNIPTILLWDPECYKIRKSNKKYYDAIHDAGILYYSPEKCANTINQIYNNPMKWWKSSKVQDAKNYFLDNMCRMTDDIAGELAKAINNMRKN